MNTWFIGCFSQKIKLSLSQKCYLCRESVDAAITHFFCRECCIYVLFCRECRDYALFDVEFYAEFLEEILRNTQNFGRNSAEKIGHWSLWTRIVNRTSCEQIVSDDNQRWKCFYEDRHNKRRQVLAWHNTLHQHRNSNMNQKDHPVGRLTGQVHGVITKNLDGWCLSRTQCTELESLLCLRQELICYNTCQKPQKLNKTF